MTPTPTNRTEPPRPPEPDPHQPPARATPAVHASRRRADLEAQKRYMDDRFGPDRPLNRHRNP